MENRTTLLYITNGISGAGGLERVLSIKASLMAEKYKYDVHIVTLNQGSQQIFYEFSDKIKYHDLTVPGVGITYVRNYVRQLKTIVKTLQPDIISVCDDGIKGLFLPYLLPRTCPIIYERHAAKQLTIGNANSLKGKVQNRMMNIGAASFDKFVVLSPENISEWPVKNISVIPNPLSFYPDEVATLEQKTVTAIGSHSYNKGYDRLLQIWKNVYAKYPDWSLHIYGKADKEQTFIKLAAELHLDGVYFHEPTPQIEQKLLKSSVFVLPSRSEGFGMVLIEAMACGVPCVSFDCPCGPKDIVTNGDDGFLVANGNLAEFAAKLEILLSDSEQRHKMGTAARKNALRYLPKVIIPQWDILFNSLLESRKSV